MLSINVVACVWFISFYFSLYTTSTCTQTHTKALHTCIHCHSRSKHFYTLEIHQTLPFIASSSNPNKRTKRACVKNVEPVDNIETGYLERWFSRNQESIEDYYLEYSRKEIISQKFTMMEWLKEEKLDEVRDLLKHHKLDENIFG